MVEKQGTVSEVIFHNDENGYTVAVFENEEEQFTIVGTLPVCHKGSSFTLMGEFVVHPTFGEQFKIKEASLKAPSTASGMEAFLASGILKGIGKKTASSIVAKFGEETFDVIENHPERLTEISGIGTAKAKRITDSFAAHRAFADLTVYLQQFDIGGTYALKLYKAYGEKAMETLESNPYCLIDEVYGIGFKKADNIALKLGIAEDDEYRIKSGIKFTLDYFSREGNTYLPENILKEKTGQLLNVSSEKVGEVLINLVFDGDVQIDNLQGQNVVYKFMYYQAEQNVTKYLAQLNSVSPKPVNARVDTLIEMTEKESGIKLSDNQKYAVKSSINMSVSVITGGPGTGKTTIINAIINILKTSGLKVAIAAPTGRAAKRITETSGHEASTVHRLLEYYYSESSDIMKFGRNSENQLEYDAIIIDEVSMMDLLLMQGLVSAIKPGSRLIMVGDADQLPSVGAGNVLRDIIESEYIYSTRLTEIFRQAEESMIVVNAHRINKGEYPSCNEKDKDFFLIRRHSEKDMLKDICDLCTDRLPGYYEELVPVRDIQVLTPVRKGLLGSINLNKKLQEVYNPACSELEERKFGDRVFREGDKVMQIKNNYQMVWKNSEDFTEGEGVFNGDIGFIEKIDREFGEVVVVFDECRYVTYDFSQLDELELAYAVTVHKSQGSEFPVIVMPVTWFPPILATRNLLYTAVTRGKQAVVLVGSEDKLNGMVDNNRITERYSGLKTRLARLLERQGD